MWDSEIDGTAKRMTSGEPTGDLRARVLARLEEQPRARRVGWTAIAAPIAALVLLMWIVTVRERPAAPAGPVEAAVTNPAVPDAPAGNFVTAAAPIEATPIAKATPANTPTPVRPPASEAPPVLAPAAEAPPAPGLEPIALEPVTVEAIQKPDAIVIEDLETAPIEIDELEIPILAQ